MNRFTALRQFLYYRLLVLQQLGQLNPRGALVLRWLNKKYAN